MFSARGSTLRGANGNHGSCRPSSPGDKIIVDGERENQRKLEELSLRSESYSRWFRARRPKKIGNVIAQVVQRRGYAQAESARHLEENWGVAMGESGKQSTRVGKIRRGTLEIVVTSSLVMQELTFRKQKLLATMQRLVPSAQIEQLRFRVGKIE